jgi:hypothetical protein
MILVGHVASMEYKIIPFRVLMKKHGLKKFMGRLWHRWEDSIKVYYKEIGGRLDGIDLAPDRDNGELSENGNEL